MLFRRQNAEMRHIQNLTPLIFLALMIVFIIALSVCTAGKGSIVILENPNGTEFTMDFKDWSAKNKCELSLTRNDVLQIEIARESGEITFAVSGKSGSEPYAGNNLKSGIFTVAVSETDKYVMQISGKDATGKIVVKNSGNRVK